MKSGRNVSGTVTIGGYAAGVYPTGPVTVTVTVGKKSSTSKVTLKNSNAGVATLSISVPDTTGSATVTVSYGGDSEYLGSTADAQALKITK